MKSLEKETSLLALMCTMKTPGDSIMKIKICTFTDNRYVLLVRIDQKTVNKL